MGCLFLWGRGRRWVWWGSRGRGRCWGGCGCLWRGGFAGFVGAGDAGVPGEAFVDDFAGSAVVAESGADGGWSGGGAAGDSSGAAGGGVAGPGGGAAAVGADPGAGGAAAGLS